MERSSGILLPISSLPSPYGIGTLGKEARDFVDFLAKAKQRWWQILPVAPTSYGDSPYQSFSAYAGNPYFIDLEQLIEIGLLKKEEVEACDWGDDPTRVDYGKIYNSRFALLEKAAVIGWQRYGGEIEAFVNQNKSWLPDYALFMALKRANGMKAWTEWEESVRMRESAALDKAREELAEDIRLFSFIQFVFFRQWRALKAYAHEKNVGIIGDMPIYVAMDSADVWADPGSFQLDSRNVPTEVSGVPPDSFTADGQLWGNPLYNWEAMKADGYGWWIRRMAGASKLYDVIRIDHFRGFESYWAVPGDAKTAKDGRWVKGPGMDLLGVLKRWFPDLEFIAEDLGYLTPQVKQLLDDFGFPGMKVLEFAFDSREPSTYLPHPYPSNCVCYPGTHDNPPLARWRKDAAKEDIALAKKYLGLNRTEGFSRGVIRGGMSSVADLFVAQMQDYLEDTGRINTPGIPSGNWQWRLTEGKLTDELALEIAEMTTRYGRA
ncbi:MAG: 4-alpha-glucanotransferase [Oscillibacter sp.]|nr:4-alpha-glucanotransferase [Oscillibacter sp.]